jgi:NADPH:quinone reductase-like Zn-dependent oxidoreductase
LDSTSTSTVGRYLIPLASRAVIGTVAVVRRGAAAEHVRQLGADDVHIDGDDLTDRATAALDSVSLRLLLEGTGDPAQVDKLVGLVEDNGSVVDFACATGLAPAIPVPDLIGSTVASRCASSTSSTGCATRGASGSQRSTASSPSSPLAA